MMTSSPLLYCHSVSGGVAVDVTTFGYKPCVFQRQCFTMGFPWCLNFSQFALECFPSLHQLHIAWNPKHCSHCWPDGILVAGSQVAVSCFLPATSTSRIPFQFGETSPRMVGWLLSIQVSNFHTLLHQIPPVKSFNTSNVIFSVSQASTSFPKSLFPSIKSPSRLHIILDSKLNKVCFCVVYKPFTQVGCDVDLRQTDLHFLTIWPTLRPGI